MMNAFKIIKYLKYLTSIFAFITIEDEMRVMFNKLAMSGIFVQLPLNAFTPNFFGY